MTALTYIILGASALSAAGLQALGAILASGAWVVGSMIVPGHIFLVPDANTSTTAAIYVNSNPALTLPTDASSETCQGFSGSLLCNRLIKLTGSGGLPKYNAGSFVCATSTCSIVSARAFVESGSDALSGGWTTTPGTASGYQLFSGYAPAIPRGGTIIGSGAYIYGHKFVAKDVPPGATVKFVWGIGNGTNDYSRTIAAVAIQYYKYYNP